MYVDQKHNWNQKPSLLERIFDMIAQQLERRELMPALLMHADKHESRSTLFPINNLLDTLKRAL